MREWMVNREQVMVRHQIILRITKVGSCGNLGLPSLERTWDIKEDYVMWIKKEGY